MYCDTYIPDYHTKTLTKCKINKMYMYLSLYFSGSFVTMFSFSYLISPKFCHRFVGYLEEEAVITYTKCLQVIEVFFYGK